jgi:predicted phage terminase large subunit-like protein
MSLTREQLAFALPGGLANYSTRGAWKYGKHHKYIEDRLLDVVQGKLKRLIISCPPRAGKSMLTSHFFPAWYLGRFPTERIILASYESTFAASWGRKARDVLVEHGESIFGVKVADSPASVDNWEIADYGGGMITAGAGSGITGKGGSLLMIDDPIKNAEEALSPNNQEKIYDWYKSTFYTRQTSDAAIVITMTRWASDDLVGKLLAEGRDEGSDQWEYINLPAFAETDDPLGRLPGEALWPEGGFDEKKYNQLRKNVGSFWFNSLYQGKPSSKEGDLIKMKWFGRYKVPPADPEMIILSLDTAQKDNEITDYTVIQTWYLYKNSFYLADVKREKMDHPRLLSVTKDLIKYRKPHAVLVEDRGSGISLIQHLELETSANVIRVMPTTDKVTRMNAESPAIEAGRVYLPESAPWLYDFEDEVRAFPKSMYRDQIDASSQALKYFREREQSVVDFW